MIWVIAVAWAVATVVLAVTGSRLAAFINAVALLAGVALVHASPVGFRWACLLAVIVAVAVGRVRSRVGGERERRRVRWVWWGLLVVGSVAGAIAMLHGLLGWPAEPGRVIVAGSLAVPLGLVLSSFEPTSRSVDRVIVNTLVAVGLMSVVGATYLIVIVGLGRIPDDTERPVLALSMVAASIAAVVALPARRRFEDRVTGWVYGDRVSLDEALSTFGGRMSRAVPMDELLLQLAETLKKTLQLSAAEIWTGAPGTYERSISVPDRPIRRLTLGSEELDVAARAHVQGNAWLSVWVPALLEGRDEKVVRMAAVAHLGDLLGLIVVERPEGATPFDEDEERVLTELARQVGLALHNVRLDSALQASLDELKVRNKELASSRLRIVTAADESRRRIERNLHDGAQQHLVALAVKVGLVKQLLAADPDTAHALLDELREDVQETLTELRDLAHGIYPPLLRDRGLSEALRTAANRSALPTDVDAAGVGRHSQETEAAVYFCCLEALQNAAKHAGDGSSVKVSVVEGRHRLCFSVADNGAGFPPESMDRVTAGHGFVNMADRLGAVGGELAIRSEVGTGTTIEGTIPLAFPS